LTSAGGSTASLADAAMTALRDEAKYWVEYGALSELIEQLEAHLSPHRFEGEGGNRLPMPRHYVTTVYFDTATWRHLESALETRQDNVKLRFKEYYDEHSSLAELATDESDVVRDGAWVWLELKRRIGTRTTKQRLRLSKFEIPKLLARKRAVLALPKGTGDVSQCVGIADYCREIGEPLEARCVVNYRRLSYQDPPGELRITIDLDLAFFAPPKSLWEEMGPLRRRCLGERLGSEDRALIEVKRRGAFPDWLTRVLTQAGARQADFSKFVRAAELVRSHG
jgi:hypothetical protein